MIFKFKTKATERAEIMYDKVVEILGEGERYNNNNLFEQIMWKIGCPLNDTRAGWPQDQLKLSIFGYGVIELSRYNSVGSLKWEIASSTRVDDVENIIDTFLYFKKLGAQKKQ